MTQDKNQTPEGPIVTAFRKMAEDRAIVSPETKVAHREKVAQALEAARGRGLEVIENPSSTRITLSASGPTPGAMLFAPEG